MMKKYEECVFEELIILSNELNYYGAIKLIPILSFDDNTNPQYLILPYKRDFIIQINDTNQNSIIYKVYFESIKCLNINKNAVQVNLFNKHFKQWIVSTVS